MVFQIHGKRGAHRLYPANPRVDPKRPFAVPGHGKVRLALQQANIAVLFIVIHLDLAIGIEHHD